MTTAGSEQTCPQCGATVPVLTGYVSWCDSCGWNVSPQAAEPPTGALARLYASAGKRFGDRLALQLIEATSLEPRLTVGLVAAYAVAVIVLGATVALVVGGLLLAVLPFPNVFAIMIGIAIALVGVEMRPRLGKVPDENVLTRAEAPKLFALVDEIAAALGTKPADLVVVSDEFNASWQVVGLRRRRVLTLGLPLLVSLEPQEQIAVTAHELAHARNGDAGRGLVVGSAVGGLGALYAFLSPRGGAVSDEVGVVDSVVNGLFWVLRLPVHAVISLELHLLLRDSRRAEYYADALAARVAGTDAVVSLHEKLLLTPLVDGVTRRHAVAQRDSASIFDEIARVVRVVPERERERRRRAARLEDARLDVTHPPTGLRIQLLEERPHAAPQVVLDAADVAAVVRELEPFRQPLQEQLLESHRDRMYARYG